ncbi:site-specific integrase [Tenacibaculum aiptasiae]|uniref:Site-specific integrase n=1 Tax=Tenacibaculum aiptasiae TaxID=426481 RepID=A0A7J5ACJ2_9FLAO|nr:site-specific integrase [Tenacibaculum aiptasiae]KAB1155297.1 site-specific integrase [Tenacibaculum aiptasiae]
MRATSTFSIFFWIYSKRAVNNKAGIYTRVTVNGKRVNISLKIKADITKWDAKKQRVKGFTQEAKTVNRTLDQAHSKIFQSYQDLKLQDKLITAQLIKALFLNEGEQAKTLQNLLDYHRRKIETTLAKGTIRNFGVTESYINRFLNTKLKTSDVYLKQLDYKFICDFETYLHEFWPKGHPKAMSQNTVMKHLQRLRKIVTLSYHLEWLDRDPFLRWKPTYEKRERQFLSENELYNLENYFFPIDRLDRVRDLFVFSCYTGISYVDIMGLTKENIQKGIDGNNWIVTKRQKTKTPIKIPILEKAQYIINKYFNHPITQVTKTLLPVITNEKLNLYLKEVAHACGITKNLTFHMARHTFATTVTLSNGVPIETVSKLLGHTKIATTQIYARVIERKVSEDINLLKLKLNDLKTKKHRNLNINYQ